MLYAIAHLVGTFFLIINTLLFAFITFAFRTVIFAIKMTTLLLVVGLANVSLFVVTRVFGWKA